MRNLGYFLVIAGLAFACSDDGGDPPAPQPMEFSTYINSGGAAITGTDWVADKDFTGGNIFPAAGPDPDLEIENTDNDALYRIERNGKDQTGFSYDIAVPANGPWDVELHFAEIFHTAVGARVFDVSIEGQVVLDNYDIFAEAGANTAVVETFSDVDVQDGSVTITFTNEVDMDFAKISGIGVSGSYIP
jgi:hypothetical protein